MKTLTTALAAIAITFAAGQALAQMSPADKTFATNAASGGLAEVALGQLAAKNAGDAKVRQFGEKMVTDHTQANQELMQLARKQDMTLPTKPSSADLATERRLQSMKGSQFDAAYMHDMVVDHQQDVTEFQQEANSGTDPALKGFAQKYLPILQQHLQMAQSATIK